MADRRVKAVGSELDAADTRTQAVAHLHTAGHIDSDALHALIQGLTLIRSSIRFAARQTRKLGEPTPLADPIDHDISGREHHG